MRTKRLLIPLLLAATVAWAAAERARADVPTPVVKITAHRFQFSPSQITLKKGQPVILRLTSSDVTHGFLSRAFKIDTDIPAGKTIALTVTPQTAGKFKVICDHYCGVGHGGMRLSVTVE